MKQLRALGMRYTDQGLEILDQTLLPQKQVWIRVDSAEQLFRIICNLQVRGAPAIGISAALLLADLARNGVLGDPLRENAELLRSARPTAVNLNYCVTRVLQSNLNDAAEIFATALKLFEDDVRLCEDIARHGVALISEDDSILTICNTGGLATAGAGTAFGIVRAAHEKGLRPQLFAMETRPLLQGGRLTAWEAGQLGIPHHLLVDSAAGALLQSGKIDRVLVGADRIAANGDTANKVGTYSLAVLANRHGVPFHVVAPSTTLDLECPDGSQIEIEQRSADEVRGTSCGFGTLQWAPEKSPVFNPAFDVTPHQLITSWILDSGNCETADQFPGN